MLEGERGREGREREREREREGERERERGRGRERESELMSGGVAWVSPPKGLIGG